MDTLKESKENFKEAILTKKFRRRQRSGHNYPLLLYIFCLRLDILSPSGFLVQKRVGPQPLIHLSQKKRLTPLLTSW